MFKRGILGVFVLINNFIFAQENEELLQYKKQYPDESVLVLNNASHVDVELSGEKLKLKNKHTRDCVYLDNKAGFFSEHSIDSYKLHELVSIEASSFAPTTKGYKEIKVKKFETKNVISNSVFFDGGKQTKFLFPSLQEGYKSHLSYTIEYEEPKLLGPFYFQDNHHTLNAEFSIRMPSTVKINWKLMNIDVSKVAFAKKEEKGNILYSWKIANVEKFKIEPGAPDIRYYVPHIIMWVESYQVNGKNIQVLSDAKTLYKWYYQLVKGVNDGHSPELKKIADSLTVNLKTDLEKVEAVYYWVQDNIKYIAFEDGMGGFVPRSAKTVCEKRYGDCKDMASIITKLLSYCNVPAYLTWIGTNSIPYRYDDVPTPVSDNHMIATYIQDGKYYFLDGTSRGTPITMPSDFIQGKEALIGIDSVRFEIVKVPITPPELNSFSDSTFLRIDNAKIIGKGISANHGSYNLTLSYRLSGSNPLDLKTIIKDYLNKSNNKLVLETVSVSPLFSRKNPVTIDYTFSIDNYAQQNKDELYVNMHLDKDNINGIIEPSRTLAYFRDNTSKLTYYTFLEIPAGYNIGYLPQDVSYTHEKFGFVFDYEKTDNGVLLKKEITYNYLMLPPEDFQAWNKMIKELKKAYAETVLLKKK